MTFVIPPDKLPEASPFCKEEKQINTNLRTIIKNDSIVIKDYKLLNELAEEEYKLEKLERTRK